MLKIIFGYGVDDETAIGNAIDEYNSVEGRKTYHESKVRQIQPNGVQQFRCEIWYTLNISEAQQKQEAEKYLFIGSDDISPYDPDWREKMAAKQLQDAADSLAEQHEWEDTTDRAKRDEEILAQETADADWRLNTDDFDGVTVTATPTVELEVQLKEDS